MIYILSRLVHGLFVLLGVSVVVFGLTWLTGDPASVLLPLNTPPDQVQAFRHNMGLDQPIPVQYAAFLGRAVRGDFGVSFRHRTAALPLVLERLPVTLRLMGAALLFSVLLALPLGVTAAAFHKNPPDFLARFIALFRQSGSAPCLGRM